MEVKNKIVKIVLKVLPYKFIRHYLYPFMVRAEKKNYDHKEFWNSYYESARNAEFSDGVTVAHNYDPLTTHFHYNLVENSILEFIIEHNVAINQLKLIDIGSGAGHWINFYNKILKLDKIYSYDISTSGVEQLKEQYKNNNLIEVYEQDIADEKITIRKVNIVNAIGVMFHLVDDQLWERALKNISNSLETGGYFIVGGQFGWITRAVQFHNQDTFSNWKDYTSYVALNEVFKLNRNTEVRVNKKIRSLSRWKNQAKKENMKMVKLYKNENPNNFIIPENNLLVFQKI